jgi:cytochrome c-type biogenesis protein CcmE
VDPSRKRKIRLVVALSAAVLPNGSAQIPVVYSGTVPDPFREGREVLVKGELEGEQFVGNDMTTKCPSKFTAQ